MIDIALLRQNPDAIKTSLKKRGLAEELVDETVALDELFRKTTQKLELLQGESNRLSKDKESAAQNKDKLSKLKTEIVEAKAKAGLAEDKLEGKLYSIANIVADDVPAGGAENNKILSTSLDNKKAASLPAHEELLSAAGSLDLTTAATYSGSRFRYLIGAGAVAQRRLMELAVNFARENGFELVIPPVVAKKELMRAAGFFPAGQDDTFALSDDQFLTGTSEPLLLALAANRKISKDQLPLRYVGFSTCFRKEAGSYGKDVKGMFRVHQFDKVEMVSIVAPEQSEQEHRFLIELQKKFVEKFDLPYQEVLLAAGDQSQIAAKQVDLECWFPSQQRYRETHSASNCTDYQSRQLKIKAMQGDQVALAHTLNATLATERLLLAIAENHAKDGEVHWPRELKG